jgi:iron complex outermembrane receptor protein
LAIALAVAAAPVPARAQESPENDDVEAQPTDSDQKSKVFQGSITVVDSPIVVGSTIGDAASLVTSVAEQQIEDLYAQDLTSALRRVPGVVISRYNPVGAFGGGDGGAFFIRGHGSGRPGGEIQFLTDGIPRFVGIWTHPLIDVANIDTVQRIDVYRSAQPVLLGNMAFGAVNMTSKRRDQPGAGGHFTGSFGTYDTLVGNLEYGARTGSLDYFVTAGHRRSNGHRDNADGEVTSFSGRVGFRLGEGWNLSVFYEHTNSSVNDPGAVDAPPPPIVPNYDIANDFVLTTLSHSLGKWDGFVKLYLDAGTFDWLQWSSVEQHEFRSITESTNYGFRWRESTSPWRGGKLVFGVDHDLYGGEFVERHPENDRLSTDQTFRNTAPFVMLSHTFPGRIAITPSAGVRYNDSRYFDDQWGGQAGVTVGLGRHSLYVNWAHAFNLPGVYAAVQYGGWGRGDQWKDLEAETIDHLEFGWLAAFGRSVQLTASLFRDEVDNAIRFVPPPPPPPLFANVGAYTIDGFELSLQVEPSESLAFFAGGTLSNADPDTVPNLPRLTAVGGMTWSGLSGWRCNVDLQWVDDRYILNPRFASGEVAVDGYFLTNFKVGIPWQRLGVELDGSIFVFGENLTNEEYEHRIGYPMPGRTIQIGLDFGF